MGNYLNKGYHLFIDNFFTSIPLAEYLYNKMTFITGTIRKNRAGLPKELVNKYKVGEKLYLRSNELLALAYREKASQKSQVVLISSNCEAGSVDTSCLRGRKLTIKKKKESSNNIIKIWEV